MNSLTFALNILQVLATAAPVALDSSDVLTRLEAEHKTEFRLHRVFDMLRDLEDAGALVHSVDGTRRLYSLSPEAAAREALWRHCRGFIADQKIHSKEVIGEIALIEVAENYEFIEGVCDIVGYHEDADDE